MRIKLKSNSIILSKNLHFFSRCFNSISFSSRDQVLKKQSSQRWPSFMQDLQVNNPIFNFQVIILYFISIFYNFYFKFCMIHVFFSLLISLLNFRPFLLHIYLLLIMVYNQKNKYAFEVVFFYSTIYGTYMVHIRDVILSYTCLIILR